MFYSCILLCLFCTLIFQLPLKEKKKKSPWWFWANKNPHFSWFSCLTVAYRILGNPHICENPLWKSSYLQQRGIFACADSSLSLSLSKIHAKSIILESTFFLIFIKSIRINPFISDRWTNADGLTEYKSQVLLTQALYPNHPKAQTCLLQTRLDSFMPQDYNDSNPPAVYLS